MSDERKLVIIVGVALLAIASIIYACTYRREEQVQVTRRTWMRAVNIERWQTVQESDWDVPSAGREIRNYRDIHHWDHIMTGSHQNCTGTGASRVCSTVYDYTDIPVYRTKYDYWIERWVMVRTPKREGVDSAPEWPDVSDLKESETLTIGDERAGMRISRYTVEFTGDYSLDMPEERWQALIPPRKVVLVLNIFGQPLDVARNSY